MLIRSGVAATTLEAVAQEAGMSKTGLYYYFPSQDALLFELVFAAFQAQGQAVHDAVEAAPNGGAALGAIVRETVRFFGPRLDDFRLAFLQGQVAGPQRLALDGRAVPAHPASSTISSLAGAAHRLSYDRESQPPRAEVTPRMMAFLAYLAALGLLTMKGMVESVNDPLIYSDEELVEALTRIFAAAAAPSAP